ncbi:thymidine phosphorylase family protein [Pontibacter ruber]|uniref:thymidine phosphorylase n=1 Tax=Pontibacter ruber TaxID=1343895 RepID=A0ABW5D2B3_9BACT|nr:thymidine phosphorylase family protein [Pontibacter ruber]
MAVHKGNILKLRRLGIDTNLENIIFMRADSQVSRSEGFTANTRVLVHHLNHTMVATLNLVTSNLLLEGEAALSDAAFNLLQAREGSLVWITHLKPIASFSDVRAKMFGKKLTEQAFRHIISDITHGYYSKIEMAAFITACTGDNLSLDEIIYLTKAMIATGTRLKWKAPVIADKHSVGGLPGNRTTPIVVPIAAAAGLIIPKVSSRAITSPAGTADTIEVLTPVNLSISRIRDVVQKEGGCMAWGGAVHLSPADDIIISVEKALDVDSSGQMIASVLSKKAAAGSTHVVIDIPVGETAKVRTTEDALKLEYYFKAVGNVIGLSIEVLVSDGAQPVGRGIGPALEARDVLAVLRNQPDAPSDLKNRSLKLAALLLESVGKVPRGAGEEKARQLLESGAALDKFYRICQAQGGFREPTEALYRHPVVATKDGVVSRVNNRKLAKLAKLAGAPKSPAAGIHFVAPLGTHVRKGQTLFTIHSESRGELAYSIDFLKTDNNLIQLDPA